ncbi:hypothetical protein FGB62_19g293 [Gracilaria domingensis]|nr:hypothetical protein FGB62_19g293 [Gracilaria domingensis]
MLPTKPVMLPCMTSCTAEATSKREDIHASGNAIKPDPAPKRLEITLLTSNPVKNGSVVVSSNNNTFGGGATCGKIPPMFKNAERCAHTLTTCEMHGTSGNKIRVSAERIANSVVWMCMDSIAAEGEKPTGVVESKNREERTPAGSERLSAVALTVTGSLTAAAAAAAAAAAVFVPLSLKSA